MSWKNQEILKQYSWQIKELDKQYQNQPKTTENTNQIWTQPQVKWQTVGQVKQTSQISQPTTDKSQIEIKKTQITPKTTPIEPKKQFWYWTTPEQREERNNNIANQLVSKAHFIWDDKKVADEIKQWVQMEWSVASEQDIMNTVNNIKEKYNQIKKDNTISSLPDNDLVNKMDKWEYSMEDLNNLKVVNPEKYNNVVNNYNKLQKNKTYTNMLNQASKEISWEVMTKKEEGKKEVDFWNKMYEVMNNLFKQSDKTDYNTIYEDYNKAINDKELIWLQDKTNNIVNEIDKLDLDITNRRKELEKKYEWTWMTRWTLEAIVSDETYELQQARNNKSLELNALNRDLETRANRIENSFKANLEKYKLEKDELNNKLQQFNTMYWIVKSEREWDYQLWADDRNWNNFVKQETFKSEQAKELAQWQEQFVKWDINSKDDSLFTKAIDYWVNEAIKLYDWFPFQRSASQITKAIKEWIKAWKYTSLEDWLDKEIRQNIVSNPLYSAWKMKKLWLDTKSNTEMKDMWSWYDEEWNEHKSYAIFQDWVFQSSYWGKPFVSNWQVDLWETPIETNIISSYWNPVKLAPTVAEMLNNAQQNLNNVWIKLSIWDSLRSYETQKKAYEKDQALPEWQRKWVANPDVWMGSFHTKWQAFDLNQWDKNMKDPRVWNELRNAGFVQHPWEWWHWSYWEFNNSDNTPKQNFTQWEEVNFNQLLNNPWFVPNAVKNANWKINQWKYKAFIDNFNKWKEQNNAIPDKTKERLYRIWDWFKDRQIVKDYDIIKTSSEFVNDILNQKTNSNDQALISTFARVLDPNSVVREWEYNTVQEYAQTKLQALYNNVKRWTDADWFLTDEAKKAMKWTIDSKLKAYQWQYNRLYDDYVNQINKAGNVKNGIDYIEWYRRIEQEKPQSKYWTWLNIFGIWNSWTNITTNNVSSFLDNLNLK